MKTKDRKYKYERVLLIDDNEIDNFINERIITTSRFSRTVEVAASGQEGLDLLNKKLEQEQPLPEMIFLDLNMPLMDGFQFLEEFEKLTKEHEGLKEQVPVMVLSSSISPADLERASVNPFVHKYLNKPLNQRYLDAISV